MTVQCTSHLPRQDAPAQKTTSAALHPHQQYVKSWAGTYHHLHHLPRPIRAAAAAFLSAWGMGVRGCFPAAACCALRASACCLFNASYCAQKVAQWEPLRSGLQCQGRAVHQGPMVSPLPCPQA